MTDTVTAALSLAPAPSAGSTPGVLAEDVLPAGSAPGVLPEVAVPAGAAMPAQRAPQAAPTPRTSVSERAALVTIIEPDAAAPLGRLGEWLFAEGLSLRVVRPWAGDSVPPVSELGDALVILGGTMSAHDDDSHPWIGELAALVRGAVAGRVPTLAICLGAQLAAEALGGETAVPSPGGPEEGVVELVMTPEAAADPLLGEALAAALRVAAVEGPDRRGPVEPGEEQRLPVIASHDDAVARLPEGAVLLAGTELSPVHAWRLGKLLALQHHPEATPATLERWTSLGTARRLRAASGAVAGEDAPGEGLPPEALIAGARAREEAERIDAVTQAFGRTLAHSLARHARARRALRTARAR